MNEEQSDRLIEILGEIRDKLDVVIPATAHKAKVIEFDSKVKFDMREKLFPTLDDKQKKLFFNIEKGLRDRIDYFNKNK